ncbi:MAG: hypothetical protein JO100_00670 [Pseudonocardia sp.]|jgi:hypothetical protein|nr:hypothetical protein [Pseudonocardia sp.]
MSAPRQGKNVLMSTPPNINGSVWGTGISPDGSTARWRYGLIALCVGLGILLLAYFVTIFRYPVASDTATAIAPMATVVGSLAGAYFGIQVGAAGKDKADAARDSAHNEAIRWAALADPDKAAELLGIPSEAPAKLVPPRAWDGEEPGGR